MLRIQDVYPGSRIQQQHQKRRWEIFFCPTSFCSYKYQKIVNYFIFDQVKEIFDCQNTKNYRTFYPKIFVLSYQKYGFGIRDSEKNLFRIPDPGLKKTPDPGFGSATLIPWKLACFPFRPGWWVSVCPWPTSPWRVFSTSSTDIQDRTSRLNCRISAAGRTFLN